ncbi:MAG: hypothetical protein OXH65_06320 [Paracoccaceae bacterium]|nr:hypothetical protein [Paracoccaceae bacterium]
MKNQSNRPEVEVQSDEVEGVGDNEASSAKAADGSGRGKRTGVAEFGTAEQEWVETALSLGMPYDMIVKLFLERFDHYQTDVCSSDELKRILRQRIKHANTSTDRVSYARIREKEALIADIFVYFPVINVIPQLIRLQGLFDNEDLRPTEVLKVIDAAQRLREKLLGDDLETSGSKTISIWEKPDSEVLGNIRFGSRKKDATS